MNKTDVAIYGRFLDRVDGGDVLVLTADAAPWDIYNPFFFNGTTARQIRSCTTARFTSRNGSFSPRLKTLLETASGVFITGGDQSKYFKFWRDSPVSELIAEIPVLGGSSAGLAVQGEFAFIALRGSIDSDLALKYPTDSEVSLTNSFLRLPWMQYVITDTHFMQRDRMGRLVAFLARIEKAGWDRVSAKGALGVGISEHSAVILNRSTGRATLSGVGPIYFLRTYGRAPSKCKDGSPLSWALPAISVLKWNGVDGGGTATFDFSSWQPVDNDFNAASVYEHYSLYVENGTLLSTQKGGGIY